MKRILPMPWLSLALLVAWPLAQGDFSAPTWIMAVLLALVLPQTARGFLSTAPSARRPLRIIALILTVTWDIVVSNVTVARIVLSPRLAIRPTFVEVPVESRHPYVLSLLASIITMTPGTVSARVIDDPTAAHPTILVHVLDTADPQAVVADIKRRYERPLLEIFG